MHGHAHAHMGMVGAHAMQVQCASYANENDPECSCGLTENNPNMAMERVSSFCNGLQTCTVTVAAQLESAHGPAEPHCPSGSNCICDIDPCYMTVKAGVIRWACVAAAAESAPYTPSGNICNATSQYRATFADLSNATISCPSGYIGVRRRPCMPAHRGAD